MIMFVNKGLKLFTVGKKIVFSMPGEGRVFFCFSQQDLPKICFFLNIAQHAYF